MRARVLVLVLLVACHTPYFVRRGDEQYKRGEYAEALYSYETEYRSRPSKGLDEKIARTKAKLVEQELKPIETAFAEGRFDDGVTGLAQLDAEKRKQPPVQAFVAKQEKRLRDELASRASRKEWGRAYVLGSRAVTVFPALVDQVPEYGRHWTEVLRPAIADADKAKTDGTAVVLRAALAVVTGDANDRSQAKQALDQLRRKYALALEVKGGGDVARVKSALAADRRFDPSSTGRGRVTITLGAPTEVKSVAPGRESARVQKGMRTVENPDRARLQANLDDKEERLASLRQQKADEMQSPSRSRESVEGYDYQIEVAQGDVNDAREDLRAAPATIEQADFVDVPFDVETHTLTVAREVTVVVDAAWKGTLASQRETVKLAKSDKAHAANAAAGVGRDPVDLPSASSLGPELDRAAVTWLDGALKKVTGQYYRSLLGGMAEGPGVALVIALYPQGANTNHVKQLEKATGVPMGPDLIDALANDKLAAAFEVHVPPASATKTAAKAQPTPTTKKTQTPTPTQTTPTTTKPTVSTTTKPIAQPTASADPMLAKAGYALPIAPFTFTRAGKVVLDVARDGTLRSGPTTIGVLRPDGVIADPRGTIVLAIDKSGALWMPRQNASSGKLSSTSLSFDGGGTLTIDATGRVRMKNDRASQLSEAVLAPNTATVRRAAMLVAWLGVGKLGMRAEK